jgi:2,4-dienoyl-CoA reductase-like NADH-dependent reductase (Old Yellow Enzyme family)
VITDFKTTKRAAQAGYKVMDSCGAWLFITSVLSPLSNVRTDVYGGV